MAEAHITWKVEILRAIINGPPNGRFYPKPQTEEAVWFQSMIADGYVTGERGTVLTPEDMRNFPMGMGRATGPEAFSWLHVTEMGKKLVYDFDRRRQAAEDFKTLDINDLSKWSDKQLAEWHSKFTTDQPQWVLADQEWKRRAGISTRRIAIAAIVVSVLSLIIAALGYYHLLNASVPPVQKGFIPAPPAATERAPATATN